MLKYCGKKSVRPKHFFAPFWYLDDVRLLLTIILTLNLLPILAQNPQDNMNLGFFANLNTSQMNISGEFSPSFTTGTQWSAGFGIYYKSAVKNMFRVEGQLAFEAIGSGKETYYQRSTNEWIRIYDRYRTIPLTILLLRNLGSEGKWAFGAGVKSSFVFGYVVRHDEPFPYGTSGIVFSPEVKKWFGSPIVQLSRNFAGSTISLNGWYAVTPLIDQYNVTVVPFGISFSVKARLIVYD